MRTYLTLLTLTIAGAFALAQDAGMQAAQMAAQQAQMAAQQANDQAMRDMQTASQNANLAMQNAQQQAVSDTGCYRCRASMPKFSVKPGKYSSTVTVKLKGGGRGSAIYYTTDGWTPTAASNRYMGPITIDATTNLQAIAISPSGGRSWVASAVYTLDGVSPMPSVTTSLTAPPDTSATPKRLLLARGTAVPFLFASDVSSKTAEVGDKISLTLAEDLKAGDAVVVKKGTPSFATVTEVEKTGVLGLPGELFFQVDSLQAGSVLIKLHGVAAKEGQDKERKAAGLMLAIPVPVALFVRGKDAEIGHGMSFTAYVDEDTVFPTVN
jgi:hypothetical protein